MAIEGRPPFRADHIGSLLRPPALRQAFRAHARNEISDEDFLCISDQCVRDVIGMQEKIGLAVVTDGEFRRGSYWGRFVEGIEGFEIRPALLKFHDDDGNEVDFTAPYTTAPLKRTQALALDEYAFVRATARAATGKITLPAPSTMHFFRFSDFADRAIYADREQFFADLVALFRAEIADLVAAGCRYIQLDEVALALLCDSAIIDGVTNTGQDPDSLSDCYIDAINGAVAAAPADVIIGVHLCRGNFRGRHLGTGGYEAVAERLFTQANVNHFLLEYDTERAGDFSPLRLVPGNKGVVLGLITSKTPSLESMDQLRRRVDEAAKHISLQRLAISPQCGFASTAAGNPLSEADQWAKLRLAVEAARKIWN
jgi:5-methyltetrahydropteroyltriglutamate--homocysteine methyltransferase